MTGSTQETPIKTINYLAALILCTALSGCISIPSPPSAVTDETFGRYQENMESDLILITLTPEYHELYTELESVPMSGQLPPLYADFLDRLDNSYGLKRVANWPLATIDIFCVVFEVENKEARESIVVALAQEPDIETAQIVQSFDSQTQEETQQYNDPYLSLQHGFHSIQTINSHQWSRGEGIRVAVIDTGMDDTHPDLVSSSESTQNFVDNDYVAFRSDTHGTAVGGLIAAEADNETGMVGIAPDANLLAIKACWYTAQDKEQARCNTLTLAKAINYSIEQEVDIINLSLTGPPDPILERLVVRALHQDIVVVGAKPVHEEKAFPVSIPGTFAVAASSPDSAILSAPGNRILSTLPNEQYDFFDGSSFATAHITGLVALMRSLSPEMTPNDLLSLLKNTADPDTGKVNACRAVEVARTQKSDQQLDTDMCS